MTWERMSVEELKAFSLRVSCDGNEADIELMNDIDMETHATAEVKQEPQTEEQLARTEFDNFSKPENIKCELRRYQDMETNTRDLLTRLQNAKYTDELQKDVSKHLSRVGAICNILTRAVGDPMKSHEWPKLKVACASVNKSGDELVKHAEGFSGKVSKKRRTTSSS